jgi:hypothetical protein
MVAGMVNARQEVRLDEGAENERLHPQYVSGNVFPSFGLEPAPDACSGRAAMSDPRGIRSQSSVTTTGRAVRP